MNKFSKSLTRTLLSVSLGLTVACGGRDPEGSGPPPNKCGSCASYEMCLSSGVCGISPSSTWFFAAVSAQIATTKTTGDAWDAFGGAPDPFVLIDGKKTTTIQDTFMPTWNEGVTYTAATLINQGVTVQVLDEDVSQNDNIGGPSLVIPTESELRRGSLTLTNFGQAQSLTFALLPR